MEVGNASPLTAGWPATRLSSFNESAGSKAGISAPRNIRSGYILFASKPASFTSAACLADSAGESQYQGLRPETVHMAVFTDRSSIHLMLSANSSAKVRRVPPPSPSSFIALLKVGGDQWQWTSTEIAGRCDCRISQTTVSASFTPALPDPCASAA